MGLATAPWRCMVCGHEWSCSADEPTYPTVEAPDGTTLHISSISAPTTTSYAWPDGTLAGWCVEHTHEEALQAMRLHGPGAFQAVSIV